MSNESGDGKPVPQEVALQQAIEEGGEGGLEQMDRREQISKFALDFLHTLNPDVERDKIDIDVFQNNIFSGSLEGQLAASGMREESSLNGYTDMLKLARFYHDNSDMNVPRRTIILGKKDPESQIEHDEKVLIYVDEDDYRTGPKRPPHDVIQFTGKKRQGFKDVPLERPDVYVKSMDDATNRKGFVGFFKKSFTIEGCDNLVIGGEITPKHPYLKRIDLSCNGQLVIMPGAVVRSEEKCRAPISLMARDIVQIGGVIAPSDISCENYTIQDGVIENPHPTTKRVDISCNKFVDDRKGQSLDSSLFNIQNDEDYHTRQIELAAELTKNKLGIEESEEESSSQEDQTDGQKRGKGWRRHLTGKSDQEDPNRTAHRMRQNAEWEKLKDEHAKQPEESKNQVEGQAGDELEKVFDSKYKPHVEMYKKADKGEPEKVVRGYSDIEADPQKVTEFLTEAQAAGWRIGNSTQVGTIMSITLEKNT